jgi:hypothetical protein
MLLLLLAAVKRVLLGNSGEFSALGLASAMIIPAV